MKVLFTQNIKNVALIGDVKEVSSGYARNFMFPNKFAKPATGGALKEVETLKKRRLAQEAATKKQAEEMVGMFEGLIIEITEDANEAGGLYGSITDERIAKELGDRKIKVKPEHVNIAEPIKKVGEHEIEIELHPEVKAKIKVVVKATEEKPLG